VIDLAPATPASTSGRWEVFRANLPAGWGNAVLLLGVWLIIIVATGAYRADFLSHQTVLAIGFTMAIVGVLAVGQALVSISGGILDLSQPTVLTLSGSIVAWVIGHGLPVPVAVLAGILAGAAWGLTNATIIVFGKINPIIVTLATNFIIFLAVLLVRPAGIFGRAA